ncbi:MAG: CDP-alcohol phosphatidyltransferase family protein [SAR202 cluster bacterium]|nr:CDP-alcohol phosphatidyltransferase family protein [SAR202 cluster bacterium]|tara:strand:+ start:3446 stop:4087 length:642 start_codon:yes stop_codon:yes gene_type:complete
MNLKSNQKIGNDSKIELMLKTIARPFIDALTGLLMRTPITPNMITIFGLVITLIASYFVLQEKLLIAGIVFIAGSGLDGLDGALARKTNRQSKFGAFLDSNVDRVQEGAIFMSLALYYFNHDNISGVALSFLAMINSYLVSYARARAEGLGFKGTSGFMTRPIRVVILGTSLILTWVIPALLIISISGFITALQRGRSVWREGTILSNTDSSR